MGDVAGYLILGLLAGVLSGLVGLGGGFVIVPALVFIFGFSPASGVSCEAEGLPNSLIKLCQETINPPTQSELENLIKLYLNDMYGSSVVVKGYDAIREVIASGEFQDVPLFDLSEVGETFVVGLIR